MSETETDAPAAQAPLEAAGAVKPKKIPGNGWSVFGWKVTRWSTLRALGNSPLARATIVIPVVGYLLIMNGEFVAWFDPDAAAVHASGVPLLYTHAWRLIFIYYGLTLTALATAWYGLTCPKLIQKYADSPDFAVAYVGVYKDTYRWTALADSIASLAVGNKRLRHADSNLKNEVRARKDEIEGGSAREAKGEKLRAVPEDALVMAALRTHYALSDLGHPIMRAIISVLYLIGLALVLCSSLWGIAEVTASLLGWQVPASPFGAPPPTLHY